MMTLMEDTIAYANDKHLSVLVYMYYLYIIAVYAFSVHTYSQT